MERISEHYPLGGSFIKYQCKIEKMKSHIVIAGSGGIGRAAGLILAAEKTFDCHIYFGDRYIDAANSSVEFVHSGCEQHDICTAFSMETEISEEMKDILKKADIILDCLPGSLAPKIAQLAKDNNLHYANLTEYVDETNQVAEIAKDADTGFVLQTGLAPGFINILAMKLFNDFTAEFKVDKVAEIKMKVGALSENALSPHFYAFTWSPIGVATEYVKDAIVVRNYKKQNHPSLSETEALIIDGDRYEDDFTSGGAADLPEALAGKVENLDYKTLRHPGHYQWAKGIIASTPDGENKIEHLEKTMLNMIPSVEDDVVIVYSSVSGKDNKGVLRAKEKSYKIYPKLVGKQKLRAIQTTTAAPLCGVARLLLEGKWKGVVYQSMIDPDEFMNGPFVKSVYGEF